MGSALGLVLSHVAVRVLEASIPVTLPAWITFGLDWRVGSLAILLAAVAALPAGLALGATPRAVLLLIVRHGMGLTVIGIGCGLAASALATRPLASVLFRVARTDLATWISACVLLAVVSVAACYLPARRAANADPGAVLR